MGKKTDNYDEVLNLIRNTVRTAEPDAQIILYGSRARGDAREDSDWDVIVLLNKPAMTHSIRNEIACDVWEKGFDIGKEINTFVYTVDQWNAAPLSLFKYNVMNEGIRL
ncbi:MAG: nucleotidyltransferase domain-containing protein [Bacteroidales bacterium]|nr:nucleotidyltransferase domain-containing protein [Bacteroidales bacterium]